MYSTSGASLGESFIKRLNEFYCGVFSLNSVIGERNYLGGNKATSAIELTEDKNEGRFFKAGVHFSRVFFFQRDFW